MGYVIRRTDQGGGYVARLGLRNTYTHDLAKARVYRTRPEAEGDRCVGNEVVVDLHDLLHSEG